MDELRWILLGLGVLIIVGVYGYARWQDWRREGPPWRRRAPAQREPFAGYDEPDIDAADPLTAEPIDRASQAGIEGEGVIGPARVVGADPAVTAEPETPVTVDEPEAPAEAPAEAPIPAFLRAHGRPGPAADATPEPAPEPAPEPQSEPAGPAPSPQPIEAPELDLGLPIEPDPVADPKSTAPPAQMPPADAEGEEKVVALSVMAPAGRRYNGQDLGQVLEAAGLRLTPQGIFRRGLDTGEGTVALYTVANIIEPGTFDAEDPASVSTPGVVLIMQLPGPFDGLATFEQMLTTARRIAGTLGGQLLDGRRCDLTTQAIEHIREELLEYRRRAHLVSRSRRRR